MRKLTDIAKVIRSKNCSPFELTLDIICRNREDYAQLKSSGSITRALIADLYGVPREEVDEVIYFDPAKALKITLRRQTPSGSPGDSDVYGAQQHAPLLGIEVDL